MPYLESAQFFNQERIAYGAPLSPTLFTTMHLSLNRLWLDTDGMLQVAVAFEGDGYAATQDIYVYPEQISEFGGKLETFPASVNGEVILEIGSPEPGAYCWFKLRAYTYDGRGHAALELVVQNNAEPPDFKQVRFSVKAEAAALNSLGSKLKHWALENSAPMEFSSHGVLQS